MRRTPRDESHAALCARVEALERRTRRIWPLSVISGVLVVVAVLQFAHNLGFWDGKWLDDVTRDPDAAHAARVQRLLGLNENVAKNVTNAHYYTAIARAPAGLKQFVVGVCPLRAEACSPDAAQTLQLRLVALHKRPIAYSRDARWAFIFAAPSEAPSPLRNVQLTYAAENTRDDRAAAILTYGQHDPQRSHSGFISELDGFRDTHLARLLMQHAAATGLAWATRNGLHAEDEPQTCPPSYLRSGLCISAVYDILRYAVTAVAPVVRVLDDAAGNRPSS